MAFTWSYSHISGFENCPKRYYHTMVAKDVVDEKSRYQIEGDELHKAFEARLRDGTPLPLGMGQHEAMLARLVSAEGRLYTEQKLGVTSTLQPTTFFGKDVWMRAVIDAAHIHNDAATIFDWKTGKPGEDTTQLAVMAVALFAHMPRVQIVKAALAFVNYGDIVVEHYRREGLTEIMAELLPRVRAIEVAKQKQHFPPKHGGLCKRFCPVVACPHHGT